MPQRFVFGFLLVYLAVMLALLPSLHHAVFYGDLTRVGHLPESRFGWRTPQPAIDAADLHASTLAQADVLVIGDSFSASHRWQSVLTRQGRKFHTLTWDEVGDSLCADRVDWLMQQGLRRNSIIVAQSVQRELMVRVAQSLRCPASSNLPALSTLTRQVGVPPSTPPEEWLNPDGNLFVGLNTWINGYRLLSCNDCLSRPWRARHAVRIASVPEGCSYFSHSSCTQALFLQDDLQRLPLDLMLIEEIAAVTRRIETQQIVWLVVPDKTSVYLGGEQAFWSALESRGLGPDLLALLRQARSSTIDLYPGNESHLSNAGFLLMGRSAAEFVNRTGPVSINYSR